MHTPEELIDTHCHLDYDYSPKDVPTLLAEAKAAGVAAFVTIGTDVASFAKVASISETYPEVFHTIGIHPHEAVTIRDEDLAVLEAAARHPRCRAVGEIGLDYHYEHSPPEIQKKRLEDQLLIARKTNQPVVIHGREAEDDLLAALKTHVKELPRETLPGIIHCFSGTTGFGQACLDLGFYISFSGILTFKNADALRESARRFPLDRLLVETDSPYLAPIPYRGKKCEPGMVKMTAQKLAEVKGIPFEDVARATTENAKRVFRIR